MTIKSFFWTAICLLFLFSCKKNPSCEGCDDNNAPVANAGPDQVITSLTATVILDGRNSYDTDGRITSFNWQKISGPGSYTITDPMASLTTVKDLVSGIYLFELRVTDNKGLISKDTTMLSVRLSIPGNQPPIAIAGPDKIITLPNNNILLDGTGSFDPDNHPITVTWTKISGPSVFSFANGNSMQTQATLHAEGIYQFVLTVTDIGNLSASDTVQIKLRPATAPVEIIFTGMTWSLWHDQNDPSGVFDEVTLSIYDTTDLFSYTPISVFVKLDLAGTWIQANQPITNANCTGPYIYNIAQTAAPNAKVLFISSCPLNPGLIGAGASVKIVY